MAWQGSWAITYRRAAVEAPMRPTSTAIQLAPLPSQFQQATPHRGAPATMAEPGQRKPQPAGRLRPCSMTHWWAMAQRSSGELPVAWATGAGATTRGVVAGGRVVGAAVVTGRGFRV